MKNDGFDEVIASYYSTNKDLPEKGKDCPSIDNLVRYASGEADSNLLYETGLHVKQCKHCSELIEGALLYSAYGDRINMEKIPSSVKNKAKALNPKFKQEEKNIMHIIKRNLWFMLFAISVSASFVVGRYFLQFLVLALVFGLKWTFDKESVRTLIMIYNAWKRHDRTGEKKIEDIFSSRF
ncbi:MAG: hypothetical protein JW800_04255 [Candidatus Omnitrophica bacterium]|nr:hypothetical protein [Candidatus Omnitrophota bacterium]